MSRTVHHTLSLGARDINDPIVTGASSIEDGRWSGVDEYLSELAATLNLELLMVVTKRWFRMKVEFKVTGNRSMVTRFWADVTATTRAYRR